MASTLIGPGTSTAPQTVVYPVVQVSESWGGGWETTPELQLLTATVQAPVHGLDRAEFKSRYGDLAHPWKSAVSTAKARDLSGWWVRIKFGGSGGSSTSWVGKIQSENRGIHGTSPSRSGRQTWVAYGAGQLLRKIALVGSKFYGSQAVDWVADFNRRDGEGRLVGNRSAAEEDGSFKFGGTGTWTRRQMLEYLLTQYADQSGVSGPSWGVSGQVDLLESVTDSVAASGWGTVSDGVSELVSSRLGLSWKIEQTGGGFSVHVFSLVSQDFSYGGVSIPVNPNTVRIKLDNDPNVLEAMVVKSQEHRFSKIRVSGARVVTCCSLRGAAGGVDKKWTAARETEYLAGTGASSDQAEWHDDARRAAHLAAVFTTFGAPESWDHAGGANTPLVRPDGTVDAQPGNAPDQQDVVRRTLGWLPLQAGLDYGTNPATDHNPSGYTAGYQAPQAYVLATMVHGSPYLPAAALPNPAHVSPLPNEWGLRVRGRWNHLLALNHFGTANDAVCLSQHDWQELVLTFAYETDERLAIEHDTGLGDGSVIEISVNDAELWFLAPNTVVGTDTNGRLVSSGAARVLRNDAARLSLVMAGAIARYGSDRGRAKVRMKGIQPWGELVGHVLTVIDEGGDTEQLQAPITSVEWSFGTSPTTTISAGFAR